MMNRHKMRENAFILIFESLFTDETPGQILEAANDCGEFEVNDYVKTLFIGTLEHRRRLDGIISEHLKGWKIDRISKVSLAILRLAMYEILYVDNVDAPIAINEAVELAKEYSVPDDAGFVNGVLGSAVRKMEGQDSGVASGD